MAVDNRDQEINKLLDALGFEESVCHIRQNMVAAKECVQNAMLGEEISCIYTGSLAEGFSGKFYSTLSRADFDFMLIFNRMPYIVDEDKTRADNFPKLPLVARVCHENVRQGYAKLEPIINEKQDSKLDIFVTVKIEDRLFVSSFETLFALTRLHRQHLSDICEEGVFDRVQFERHGPASSVTVESRDQGYAKRDFVYGHRCQFWPKCARNWITRKRKWPKMTDVKNATEQGCHLVPTGFPGSKTEELEWRYSFVKPERNIMWLFNDCQRKCYALLKILNKEKLASHFDTEVITSYHVKTTLLWVLEETDDSDWSVRTLLNCVKTCLGKLITFLKSRHCPHYFIEHANLFERDVFHEETCGKLCSILYSIMEDPYTALRNCPTFQIFKSDITFIDFDFLHRCQLGFQWFMMCDQQLEEFVSMLENPYSRVMLCHYKTNKTKRILEKLEAMADKPLQKLFLRPYVLLNNTILGILNHIDVTMMNPMDEEEVEIRDLFIDDARKYFIEGAKGMDVDAKLRLANFELMMEEYDRVEEILKEIVFENNLYGSGRELTRQIEKTFYETISDVIDRQSMAEKTRDIKCKYFIERAYIYAMSQGMLENHEGHVQPLIDMVKNFLKFLSKEWLLTDVILLQEEINCVPFPFQLELAVLKTSPSDEKCVFYHPKIFALALRCLASLAQNKFETAQMFCDEMTSSLQRIPRKYHAKSLNLFGHLLLRISNLDDAWSSFSKACRLTEARVSMTWFIALFLLKKFKN